MGQKQMSIPIKKWSPGDRPREKLIQSGSRSLTESELLAILIGSGNRSESALDLSKRILASVNNNLNGLGKLSVQDLIVFKGIGQAKAVGIAAALELGRRRGAVVVQEKPSITSSKAVFDLMQPLLGELPHEEFWILYLNNSNRVLNKKQLSIGGITGTLVDVRLVLKTALNLHATAMILVHNHPSGALIPSKADKALTSKLKSASQSLDLKVLDHVIITEKAYFSFADEAIL
ncbi:MAG: DNA repair protein RadC [Flavobacteriaceae bacterium]|nr:DNA repair protein RadC [Bacteroidia bacterium]NNF74182.1 DNA repair protein RadC [Flavobacteriaceae bacterium]NNK73632.1 DNA repair protein RadC [Flavobacteriaceae bacterium]